MRCLVTGGVGFIGSHLANYLKDQGHFVRVVDIKRSRDCYLPLRADEIKQADLRYRDIVEEVSKDMNWIFALGADMGGINYITKIGADIMRNNSTININTLEACRKYDINRIFFSSSACIYNEELQREAEVQSLKESDASPASPGTYYGWEKLYMEKLMKAYQEDYDIDPRIARFHNIYGPSGTYKGGKEKAPAALCRKVAQADDPGTITIWGDGEQTRSFLYIDDGVRGIYDIMCNDCTEPLNLGSDELISINELAELIIDISGKEIEIEHDLSKPQGVRGRNADLTKIRDTIGWDYKVNYREGLTRTYNWIEKMINNEETEKKAPR